MSELPDLDGVQEVQPAPPSLLHPGAVSPAQGDARDWDRCRVTVVEHVYHQQIGGDPVAIETSFSRLLESEEERYQRTLKTGEAWTKLDCGHVPEASVLTLKNLEGVFRSVNPTPEEEAEAAKRVIEVGLWIGELIEPLDEVRPQEAIRRCPLDLSRLYVRCRCGTAKFRLMLIPR